MSRRLLVLLVTIFVVATGCKAAVTTTITIESASTNHIVASVVFDGDAAKAVVKDPSLGKQIEAIFVRSLGHPPTRQDSSDTITWTASLTYAQLTASSGLTGIASAGTAAAGDNQVRLTALMVVPAQLIDALKTVKDKAALPALLDGTHVAVAVKYPGDVTSANGPAPVTTDGNTVTLDQSLTDFKAGTFTALGSTESPSSSKLVYVVGILVLGALAGSYIVWRRRTQHQPYQQ